MKILHFFTFVLLITCSNWVQGIVKKVRPGLFDTKYICMFGENDIIFWENVSKTSFLSDCLFYVFPFHAGYQLPTNCQEEILSTCEQRYW